MQIKRHWFLVETMPFEYFFSGVYTLSGSYSSDRLRGARPMGSPRRLAVARDGGLAAQSLSPKGPTATRG